MCGFAILNVLFLRYEEHDELKQIIFKTSLARNKHNPIFQQQL